MQEHRPIDHRAEIDRQALVDRHAVEIREILPRSPLTVGNGEFCFTADVTGLQSFADLYPVGLGADIVAGTMLGTQSHWGWHSVPPKQDYRIEDALVEYASPRGPVPYVDMGGAIVERREQDTPEGELWLRSNPHRLDLGRIGFVTGDHEHAAIKAGQLDKVDQRLDLWRGELSSAFNYAGSPVHVTTLCDPELDLLAIRVEQDEQRPGRAGLAVMINFPYGNQAWHNAADWTQPEAHQTELTRTAAGWTLQRTVDDTQYAVIIAETEGVSISQVGPQGFVLDLGRPVSELIISFVAGTPQAPALPSFEAVRGRARQHWERFWCSGAAVQLAESMDPRAWEIERRTVLSQYVTAVSAGSLPPQETGLVCNSWYGKFHLEMHWWHSAHFALWGRPEMLLRSLRWYHGALPMARETAARQGFAGVRWPKQVGPNAKEAPSTIGPFLVWQQPHPIHLAELAYRAAPDPQVLQEFADIVFATADFMASFAVETERGFELGPPLIPAQESYGRIRGRVQNPAFELVYWHWALKTAQQWRQRLGLAPKRQWEAVSAGMIKPVVRKGIYPAIDVEPYTIRTDHPSMLCALGVLPATEKIDPVIMAATLDDVLADWDWGSTWGWDYPVIAMCAARLGQPERAVEALLMGEEKNIVLPNGHNWQSTSLPLYLPGNGGLLSAVALMAGGWERGPLDGSGKPVAAPGFPQSPGWSVQAEGLTPAP